MQSKTYHIVPNSLKGGWDVKKGGGEKSLKHFEIKKDAFNFGRDVCINQGAELVIHGKDGKIKNKNSYGNDPYPPKDTK